MIENKKQKKNKKKCFFGNYTRVKGKNILGTF